MDKSPVYVLDANIFIRAHREYYAFDIAPGFWDGLKSKAEEGRLVSIDKVYKELMRGYDPQKPDEADLLSKWAMSEFAPYFDRTNTEAILQSYTKVVSWVSQNPYYPQSVKLDFAKEDLADSWLVAYAMAHNAIIVTHEKSSNTKSKVPIPILCKIFDVQHVDTFKLLRELKITLA